MNKPTRGSTSVVWVFLLIVLIAIPIISSFPTVRAFVFYLPVLLQPNQSGAAHSVDALPAMIRELFVPEAKNIEYLGKSGMIIVSARYSCSKEEFSAWAGQFEEDDVRHPVGTLSVPNFWGSKPWQRIEYDIGNEEVLAIGIEWGSGVAESYWFSDRKEVILQATAR